eukprot:305794_1
MPKKSPPLTRISTDPDMSYPDLNKYSTMPTKGPSLTRVSTDPDMSKHRIISIPSLMQTNSNLIQIEHAELSPAPPPVPIYMPLGNTQTHIKQIYGNNNKNVNISFNNNNSNNYNPYYTNTQPQQKQKHVYNRSKPGDDYRNSMYKETSIYTIHNMNHSDEYDMKYDDSDDDIPQPTINDTHKHNDSRSVQTPVKLAKKKDSNSGSNNSG